MVVGSLIGLLKVWWPVIFIGLVFGLMMELFIILLLVFGSWDEIISG